MNKILAVAMREYKVNVKSKAFVIGLVVMPIFMFGGVAMQKFIEKRGDRSVKRVAVIDETNSLFAGLQQAAEDRNKNDIFDPETGLQKEATFEFFEIPPTEDRRAQLLDLSERVRSDEFFAFV